MILVDTDVMVDFLRGHPSAGEWFTSLGQEPVGMPGFVVLELMDGQPDKDSMRRLLRKLERFIIYWPGADDCRRALDVFAHAKLSHGSGPLDVLIGQTARGLGVPLHTFNVKHYEPIPGLETVQPYARTASAG